MAAKKKIAEKTEPEVKSASAELQEDARLVTATKQMIGTSDGTASDVGGRVEEVEYDDSVEVPEAPEWEQHDPEDVNYEGLPHAGAAEDDPGGPAPDDPAGTADKDDNYAGEGKTEALVEEEARIAEANEAVAEAKAADAPEEAPADEPPPSDAA